MTDDTTPRTVHARRMLTLGTVAATLAVPAAATTGAPQVSDTPPSISQQAGNSNSIVLAEGEGEGEGEASAAIKADGKGLFAAGSEQGEGEGEGEGGGGGDPTVTFLRDLGFMTGHLRAGMALYAQGDLEAARTHMGHPIKEKYEAVAGPLEKLGFSGLRADIVALSNAAEAGADVADIQARFDHVIEEVGEVRAATPAGARDRLMALAALTRIAAEEYTVAVEGGTVSNLHEYQDAWGFVRTVEAEATRFANSDDPAVAKAGARIVEQVGVADAAFGDLQGAGDFRMDPSLLFAAAARMELAALEVK